MNIRAQQNRQLLQMAHFIRSLFLLASLIGCFSFLIIPQADAVDLHKKARKALASEDFDKAIELYRKIVRTNKKNFNTWTLLAAAYYHTGLPRRALRYLKFSEKKTTLKSYNYFYQGLCYDALGIRSKARAYFKNSANINDAYGGRSMYELGVTDYQRRRKEKAGHWLNLYIQRHPKGKYRKSAMRILQSIRQGKHLKGVKGVDRPDLDKALYKYNKLSLHPLPHYWFSQLGGDYHETELKEKDNKGNFNRRLDFQQSIIANAGIGIGPLKKQQGTIWAGYSYRQLWGTNGDRLNGFINDPSFEYQPFRPDLLERHHQLYADVRTQLPYNIYAGLYSRLEFARIGSSFYTGPEIQSIDPEVLAISNITLLIPWVGYSWNSNSRSLAYFYFRQELNLESPEHSFQTYTFDVAQEDNVPLSFGASHTMTFPKFKLDVNVELYQYEFIVNDYWLDFTKRGINGSIEHQIFPRLYVNFLGGYYSDKYFQKILRHGSCSKLPTTDPNDPDSAISSLPIKTCYRDDSGFLIRVGAYWNYSQFHRIEGNLTISENQNPNQTEFETSQLSYMVVATMAFPSVKRVTRFIDRFADAAFTKSIQ